MTADVITIVEVDALWREALSSLEEYELFAVPRPDNFGIAILSRLPISHAAAIELGSAGLPSIEAQLDWNGTTIDLLTTHPPPPVGADRTRQRNRQLLDIADWAAARDEPTIVVGDLNTTPFSHTFRNLLQTAELVDSSAGQLLGATWPSRFGPLGVNIDHVLHDHHFTTTSREVGRSIGSDHRAVQVELSIQAVQTE